MKILIAGATGAIGRLMLPKLVQAGHEAVGITRNVHNCKKIEQLGAKALAVDVFDREAIMQAVQQVQPDLIIHQLTSLSSRDFADNTRVRIEGTRHLVDAAKSAGVTRMIAQSIAFAYGPGDKPAVETEPLDTDAPEPRKTTIDGVAALEQAVSEMPNHVILRYGMLYGPGTWYERDGYMANLVMQGQLPASDAVTSFLHVEDAAEAAVQALNWSSSIVNIVDDEPATAAEWLPVYAVALGAPGPASQTGRQAWERGASNSKAKSIYGWNPIYPTWRSGFVSSLEV